MTTRLDLIPFFEYCKKSKINLLKGDRDFIYNICAPHPYESVRKSLSKYTKIWVAMGRCEMPSHKKENYSRFNANQWLFKELKGKPETLSLSNW